MRAPGTVFLIDTSALSRARHPEVAEIINTLSQNGVAAACATVDLEMGYCARTAESVSEVRRTRSVLYRRLPVDDRAGRRAKAVQQFLAHRGMHRTATTVDLLTAATAELHGAVLLHYNADFEQVALVCSLQQQWIVARGSAD